MPFLIPLAAVIASAIGAAIAAVAAAIGPIIIAVGSAIAAVAAVIGSIAATVISGVTTALTWTAGYVWAQIGWLSEWMAVKAKIVYTWFSGYVNSISTTFREILKVIHFKTILQVHSIVYVVSPQYRAMMTKVYDAIGKASQALGLGAQFLTLAIQNTRNLVMDVSGMIGQKYDLAQVVWLGTLNKYLDHFNRNATKYMNNPEAVFWDLAELIERPAQDAKGAFQQSIISGVDTALDFAKVLADNFMRIGIDVETLYDDLPQFLKDRIPDPGDVFWDNLQGWMQEWYIPTVNRLDTEIAAWQGRLNEAQARTSSLVQDLRRPGTVMKAIDTLSPAERTQQENLIFEISNRRLGDLIFDMAPMFAWEKQELEIAARVPIPPPIESAPLTYEPVTAHLTGVTPMTPRNTWFVGDF